MTGKTGESPMEIGMGVRLAEPSDPAIPTPRRWITPPLSTLDADIALPAELPPATPSIRDRLRVAGVTSQQLRHIDVLLIGPWVVDFDPTGGRRGRCPAPVLTLALEAYRRDQITRAKLVELAALLSMREEEVDQLLERAGLADGDSADVLIPGE